MSWEHTSVQLDIVAFNFLDMYHMVVKPSSRFTLTITMLRLSGATRRCCSQPLKQISGIRPGNGAFNGRIAALRKISTDPKEQAEKTQSSALLEYHGAYSETYKKLKVFSLSSLGLAAAITPMMFILDSTIPAGGRAILGITAMTTSSISTSLIAWAGRSYVTDLRVDDGGRRIDFITTTMLLRKLTTTVYDPMFLEPAEHYFTKVRLRSSIRIPMAVVQKQQMNLVDGQEETVAETTDSKGRVKGWWEVRWRQEGDAGFVGECRGVGKVMR